MTATHPTSTTDGASWTRRAWWSLLGFVLSLPLAFVVGEGLVSALGYPSGGDAVPPWWAALTAAIPALVVFALPAAFTVAFGQRAVRLGDARGRVPMRVGVAVAGAFVLLNVLSALPMLLA